MRGTASGGQSPATGRLALVLRPGEGAVRTAARIDALEGWRAACVPLTSREATGVSAPAGAFDAVVLTSAAAVPALALLSGSIGRRPIHAIGEATAAAVRNGGHPNVVVGTDGTAPRDGGALGRALARGGGRFLYPCAENRSPDLERALGEGGATVRPWPVYRTVPRADAGDALRALDADPAAVLLHAPSAARALGAVCRGAPDVAARLEGALMLCLSARVARGLPAGVGGERRVAETPDEDALLARLER